MSVSQKTSEKDKIEIEESDEMGKLLAGEKAPKLPEKGELVEGKVIEIGSNSIYLDLGPAGTGIIYGRELFDGLGDLKDLKVGDPLAANVVELENKDGYIELSFKEASYEKVWRELTRKMEEEEVVTTKILSANKGGLMVKINSISGFLPVSQLASKHYPRVEGGDKNKILTLLNQMVNQNFQVKIIGLDREEEKLIVSEKAVQVKEEEKLIKELEIGAEVEGEVSGIVDFGAFVKFNRLEGLVHISEMAWQLVENPRQIVKVGQKVRVKIIGIDRSRISLSIKALQEDPWKTAAKSYKVGQKVKGTVTKINPFGAFVQLDETIHGLVHLSKMTEEDGKARELKIGEKYDFEILSLEPEEHRLGLAIFSTKKKEEKKTKDKKEEKESKKESKTEDKKKEKKEKVSKKSEEKAKKADKPDKKEDKKKEDKQKADKKNKKSE